MRFSEFRVNQKSFGAISESNVLRLDGKVLISWSSRDTKEINAQLFTLGGAKIGGELVISPYQEGNEYYYYDHTRIGDNKFIALWSNNGGGQLAKGLYGQIFDSDGNKSGDKIFLPAIKNTLYEIRLATLDDKSVVVTWSSNNFGDSFANIYSQSIDLNGIPSPNVYQITPAWAKQSFHGIDMAPLSGNKFVVVWEDVSHVLEDKWGIGLLARVLHADGKGYNPFVVNTQAYGNQKGPSIVHLDQDQFVVTWRDDLRNGISAQLCEWPGTKIGKELIVNKDPFSGFQQEIDSLRINTDTIVVTWSDRNQNSQDFNILAQVLNVKTGGTFDNDIEINENKAGLQTEPVIGMVTSSFFMVSWLNKVDQWENANLYARWMQVEPNTFSSDRLIHKYDTIDVVLSLGNEPTPLDIVGYSPLIGCLLPEEHIDL